MSDAIIEAQRWREMADGLAEALSALTNATGEETHEKSCEAWTYADDVLRAYGEAVAEDDEDSP